MTIESLVKEVESVLQVIKVPENRPSKVGILELTHDAKIKTREMYFIIIVGKMAYNVLGLCAVRLSKP